MTGHPEKQELLDRIGRVHTLLGKQYGDWDAAFFVDKLNQFYLTDTLQNGVFVLRRDGEYAYLVRTSYELARRQSPLLDIYPMKTYRDLLGFIDKDCPRACVETRTMTLDILGRLKKHVHIGELLTADPAIARARAVKSAYELSCMELSGRQHGDILENVVPGLLREGMSEADLSGELFAHMMKLDYQGMIRFSMFQTELVAGQIGFGESSLSPTCFDGAGGNHGLCHAVSTGGSRQRFLKKGDLVFVDIGYGVGGYHTDRTQLYLFGQAPTADMLKVHRACLGIQMRAAAQLKPGVRPSDIYEQAMREVDPVLLPNFMGYGDKKVAFIGHGIGLHMDETPVIARGFDEPLEENMVFALEPKNGVPGVGLLGAEDTYVVTPEGGRCLTGGEKDILQV